MTTYTATRASSTKPVYKPTGAGLKCTAWGHYDVAAALLTGDVIEFCRIPKGAVVVGGYLYGNSIESSTEAFSMDIGWAANGVDALDADGLGDLGVLAAAAVAGVKPETGYRYPLGGTLYASSGGGPKAFSAETVITGTVVASAAVFTTGSFGVVVDYIVP